MAAFLSAPTGSGATSPPARSWRADLGRIGLVAALAAFGLGSRSHHRRLPRRLVDEVLSA